MTGGQRKDGLKMKENRKRAFLGIVLLAAFILWTILIQQIDLQRVGPQETEIGFATFNVWFHQMTGVHNQYLSQA